MVRGGTDRVVLLSHSFWLNEFGGSESDVGGSLTLGGLPYQVLGVLPQDMRFPTERADVFVPYSTIPDSGIPRLRQVRTLAVVARARPGVGQDAVQEQKLMYQDVLDKLARLPDDQRAVLLLVAVEDLSYADAARVLDIPIGTVMSRLSRAREKLQQEIEGTADGAPKKVVQLRSMK